MFGVGASFNYVAIMGVAPQWFTKRRGLALGIITSGSGIGGLAIPFIMNASNQSIGANWTYRIMGFVCFACGVVAFCFVKERTPKPKTKKKLSQILRLECLKDVNVLLFMIGSDIGLFGYFIPYFFIPCKLRSCFIKKKKKKCMYTNTFIIISLCHLSWFINFSGYSSCSCYCNM